MYKKSKKLALIISFSLFISIIPAINASAINTNSKSLNEISVQAILPQLNLNTVNDGYVKIAYINENDTKMKVLVEKNNIKYYYDFDGKGNYENYSLNMGDGDYNIYLLENTEGKNYMIIDEWNIEAKIINPNLAYIVSNKIVNFANSKNVIEIAKELTKNIKTDEAKAIAIYNYVTTNIKYDIKKIDTLASGYVPNIEEIMKSKNGICYDFAAVYGGMLRGVGIPAKLIMGNSKNVKGYHAWNEVFINGKWIIIDTSYDSQAKQVKAKIDMYKQSIDYKQDKQY